VSRYFAFLRAINTGNRRLTNEQLLAPFEAMGFDDVEAHQAAGNVTFRTDDSVDEPAIEGELARAYGFVTPTFVRTSDELATITAADHFGADHLAASDGKVQVTFLHERPSASMINEALALVPAEDRVVVAGREWYWLPVTGISASKLPVSAIEGVLGEMTMRTLGTLERMVAKFGD
jgi:uncharacterized protein (DUF1697 family)